MKKSIKLLLIAVIYLSVCYGVGQYRNLLKEGADATESNTADSENAANSGETEMWDSISFEGVKETTDTPWNFNAGIFDMEGEGACILLTPNTAVTVANLEDIDSLSFRYEIHPWVKDASDGAGLLIWILDVDENIIDEFTAEVKCNNEWQNYELDLDKYENAESVKIQCNNGENGDDSGDWVVIKANKAEDIVTK